MQLIVKNKKNRNSDLLFRELEKSDYHVVKMTIN